MGLLRGILKVFRNFLLGLVKQWAEYIAQATGVVAALVFSPYLQYSADVRQDVVYFLEVYAASVFVIKIAYRDKRWSLLYARQFFRFVQWFIAVLASIFAPFVLGFLQFLTIPGVVPKLAVSFIVLILLLFVGIFVGLGEIFKLVENMWVEGFQNRFATPNYEAILMGEEFEHHPNPQRTRRALLRISWEQEMRRVRRSLRNLRDP